MGKTLKGLIDSQEKSSAPTGYILYIAQGDGGFDNGTVLRGTSCTLRLQPNVLYSFQVRAINEGGRSFPTEVLSAYYNPQAPYRAMIVNGFHRLSSPAISSECSWPTLTIRPTPRRFSARTLLQGSAPCLRFL